MKVPTNSTGKPLQIVSRPDKVKFRGEVYDCVFISFLDEETGESFTTTESDTVWYNQVTNQYRERHGIPYPDEIIALRKMYGVSAAKMSVILGFGANQYRLYEEGEMPSESNGKMIRSVMNPRVFMDMVKSSRYQLTEREYAKFSSQVEDVIAQTKGRSNESWVESWVYKSCRGAVNGFAPLSPSRLKNLLLYVLAQIGETFQTKMNKILFYIDFLSYKERGIAISGLTYQAIDFGPVPLRWDRVYSAFDEVEQQSKMVQNQECLTLKAGEEADMASFSEEEIEIIDKVCARMKRMTSRAASELSHKEEAWKNYVGKSGTIPFKEAFSLSGM